MITRYTTYTLRTTLFLVIFSLMSCEELLDVGPPKNEIVTEKVFSSETSAMSALRGIYSAMISSQSFTSGEIEFFTGLSGDELISHFTTSERNQFFLNDLLADNTIVHSMFWSEAYRYINNANNIIEALSGSSLPERTARHMEGEARFIRAFCHFYLVNLFGEVPYITTTDYQANSSAGRIHVDEVYASIVADLQIAEQIMVDDYSFSNNRRTQPNRNVAQAMLARVYLYMGDFEKAEHYATMIIDNGARFSLESDLNSVFLSSSQEAIWQLHPVTPENSTPQGQRFVITSDPAVSGKASLRKSFLECFEADDQRRMSWVGTFINGGDTLYYPFKYKVVFAPTITEHSVVLRLAEQYLIRAEARAMMNELPGAIADLDRIRNRAGLESIAVVNPSVSQSELLALIFEERQRELFVEWGHRWFDLKRTGKVDAVLEGLKVDWEPHDALYPIPLSEILVNPALDQNPGY